MTSGARASTPLLAAQLKQALDLCRDASGGVDKNLVGALSQRRVDVNTPDITKWRRFAKYGKVPPPEVAKALADILRGDRAAKQAAPAVAAQLAQEIESVCARLRQIVANPEAPTLEGFVAQTQQQLAELLRSTSHPWFPSETVELLWTGLSEDFGSVLSSPSRIVENMRYTISITGNGDEWNVTTSNEGKRVFPDVDRVFVSYCSTPEALDHEYAEQAAGCIAREFVEHRADETYKAWSDRVLAHTCTVRIDGSDPRPESEGPQVADYDQGFILRRYFDSADTELGKVLTPAEVRTRFVLPAGTDHFPIHFTSYYCVGTTRIDFKVSHPDRELVLHESAFLPSPRSAPLSPSSEGPGHIELVTSRRTVLAPGSGVFFRWSTKAASEGAKASPDPGRSRGR